MFFRYIYVPLIGIGPQLASACCFSFVFVWHGITLNILIWSFLNYIGIAAENLAKDVWHNEMYQCFEVNQDHIMYFSIIQLLMEFPL